MEKKGTSSTNSDNEVNMQSLICLFEKSNVFPLDQNVKRKMTSDFLWNFVELRKKVGTVVHGKK